MATRLERVMARRMDDQVVGAQLRNEGYRQLMQTDSVRYTIGAMQPIDPVYTKNTYEQGDRVCNQLDQRLSTSCEFEYQGSVTNDTHIRARSDIDVLALTTDFVTLERPQQVSSPYGGDPVQHLVELRDEAISSLRRAFPEAEVDASGSKSITVEGGSLRRKIDVVPSNWFNTNVYKASGRKADRGVQILDARARKRLKNTPFLHNERIEQRDVATAGGLRKAARLMKSLKYDSGDVDLSSYDVVSIAYNVPERSLAMAPGQELRILDACLGYCEYLRSQSALRASIDVPDGHRKVFCEGHATDQGLEQLVRELSALKNDVLNENVRSFRALSEARVEY